MIGDTDLKVAKLYGMLPAAAGETCEGRTAADNATVRNVYVIGPDKKIKLVLSYPMSTGRNFDEVLRVIDSMQLTAKHKVATPVNWKDGQDVIILPAVIGRRGEAEVSAGVEGAEAVPAHRAAAEVMRRARTRSILALAVMRIRAGRRANARRRTGRSGAARTATARRRSPLPTAWPEKLTLKWKVDVGTGYAAPITVGDRVFAFSRQGEDEVMRALDAATGKTIWETRYNATYKPNRGGHAHARHRTEVHADVRRRPALHARHDRRRHGVRRGDRQAALAEARRGRSSRCITPRCRRWSIAAW